VSGSHRKAGSALLLGVLVAACAGSAPRSDSELVQEWIAELSLEEPAAASATAPASAEAPPAETGAEAAPARVALGQLTERERPISLREVLVLVDSQGLDVAVARERILAARAEAAIARAAWWPQVNLGTSVFRSEGAVQGTFGNFWDVDKQSAFAGAQLSMEFDLGDAIYGTRAAAMRAEASQHAAQAATNDALTLAAFTYFDLLESYARIPIAEEAARHAELLVQFEKARLDGGSGLAADLSRARAHRATTQRVVIGARNQARQTSALLVELLKLSAGTVLSPDASGLGALDILLQGQAPEGGEVSDMSLELALFGGRPELREADAELRAREAEADAAAWAWLLPEVVVGARFGGLGYNYSELDSQNTYAAGLRWDLGAQLVGESDRDSSRRREAALLREQTRLRIVRELETAAAQCEAARLTMQSTAEEVSAARASFELAVERHRRGAGLLIQVLEAQINQVRAEAARIEAIADFNRAQFGLRRAEGSIGTGVEIVE